MAIQVFSWLSKFGSQIHKNCKTKLNLITSYYLTQLLRYEYATSVRPTPNKTRVVSCFPSFLITWIISSSSICITPSRLSFFKCWQLSAIKRTVSPLNPCWKENICFTLTKSVLIVALITRHYTYNSIKLMHNKEVFFMHFPFRLLYPHNKAGKLRYHVTLRCTEATTVAVDEQVVLHISKVFVCMYPWVSCMQCARSILSFATCPALLHFSTLPHQWHDFWKRKKVTANKMCVLIFFTTLKYFSF